MRTNDLDEFLVNLKLLIMPAAVSTFVAVVWYFFFFDRIHYFKEDETIMTQTGFGAKITFHAVIAAIFLGKVAPGYVKAKKCILNQNEEGFHECVEDRLPMPVHILLGVMSVFALSNCLLLPYHGAYAGFDNVFSTVFTLVLYWGVATKLDDPRKAPGLRDKINPEWLKKYKRNC
jgi:hypothetical protein